MSLLDLLQQYTNPNPAAAATSQAHFDQVAPSVPRDVLGRGLTETMRSDQTPPFGDMVSQLFGRSNPQQRAGLLNQILAVAGPAVLSRFGPSLLGQGASPAAGATAAPTVTPEQAAQLSEGQVRDIAAHAEAQEPGVVDKVGNFYAEHPDLVRGLGGMAVAVLLGKMAQR